MTNYYHSGVALAKKKGKDIHVVETPVGIGDMLPVAAAGTAYPRQLRYRFADVINVKDFGAIGDGVHDDTAAFRSAAATGSRVVVPRGTYKVDCTGLRMEHFFGEGLIRSLTTGALFRASGASVLSTTAFESLCGYPKVESTGTGAVTGTPIFPSAATRAQQGGAYCMTPDGIEHYFVAFRTASNTGSTGGNACRIAEYRFNTDGTLNPEVVQFTAELPIGHGQGLGVTVEDGEVYLWANDAYLTSDTVHRRGVSKTHWRGASTAESDITYLKLLADDDPMQISTPTISADGRYLICLCTSPEGFRILGWTLAGLTELSEPEINFAAASPAYHSFLQGICADSHFIYAVSGSGALTLPNGVLVFDYQGNFVKVIYAATDTHVYGGFDGIVNRTENLVYSCELEHLIIHGGDLLIGGIISERDYGAIVSDGDYRYAAVVSNDTDDEGTEIVAGEYLDSDYWQPTALAATAGEFSKGETYTLGAVTLRRKFLYRLGASTGSAEEFPASDQSGNDQPVINGYKNVTFTTREQNGFYFRGKRAIDGRVYNLFTVNHRGNMYLFDGDAGADHSHSSMLYTRHLSSGNEYVKLNGGSDNSTSGSITLHGTYDTQSNLWASFGYGQEADHGIGITKTGLLVIPTYLTNGEDVSFSSFGVCFARDSVSKVSTGKEKNVAGLVKSSTQNFGLYSYNRGLTLGAINLNGNDWDFGIRICFAGTTAGGAELQRGLLPAYDAKGTFGSAALRWSEMFSATGTINTSDERLKQNIGDIPEEVLKAWGDVKWCQYRFKDAVAQKGDAARYHTGLIAQRIDEAFKAHGLDARKYGLLCYDEWAEQVAEVDPKTGEEVEPYRAAGSRWSVRYEEALALECAYQRWRLAQIEARL